MAKLVDFNPLKSIAMPNVGRLQPHGLVVIIGPNSAGKTQMLKDIEGRVLGQARKLVVCEDIELQRPPDLDGLLDVLCAERHIRRRVDTDNNVYIDSRMPYLGDLTQANWSISERALKDYYNHDGNSSPTGEHTDRFLGHLGRSFMSSLLLDRRLVLTNTVEGFDYETKPPTNELQTLYLNLAAKEALTAESNRVFGKTIWLDHTRGNKLCLRVADESQQPSAEDRHEPEKMRKCPLIEDEGDGFKSYMGTCVTLLLGQRPVCLIDEPELCLHPPQAYALGRFVGKYGVSTERVTFVATHSSHVLRGIIEQTSQLEIIRLSRAGPRFSGRKVSHESIHACIVKPSTKVETILDGLFAEAVTIVEAEGDRLVYSTTWERLASEFRRDVHRVRRTLSDLSGGLSQTARLKNGVESLSSQPVYHDLKAFLGTCRRFGLFLVPCGELENWVPSLMVDGPSKKRKPEWANAAANKIREAAVGTDDIWAFIRQMARFQGDEASRLSGYSL